MLKMQDHPFNDVRAVVRIFRFAVNTLSRLLEVSRINGIMHRCAERNGRLVMPGLLSNEYAKGCYFNLYNNLQKLVKSCPWLVLQVFECRCVPGIPARVLQENAMIHDVKWAEDQVFYQNGLSLINNMSLLMFNGPGRNAWAQGTIGVSKGKHFFYVNVRAKNRFFQIGWLDYKLQFNNGKYFQDNNFSQAKGAVFHTGFLCFHDAPFLLPDYPILHPGVYQGTVGCLLDLENSTMTVIYDGARVELRGKTFQTEHTWYPVICLCSPGDYAISVSSD